MRFYRIIITNALASEMFTSGERVYNVIGGLPEDARLCKCELIEIGLRDTPNLKLTFVTHESSGENDDVGGIDNPIQLKPIMGERVEQN